MELLKEVKWKDEQLVFSSSVSDLLTSNLLQVLERAWVFKFWGPGTLFFITSCLVFGFWGVEVEEEGREKQVCFF